MKIAQITDVHIVQKGVLPNDINVRKNFMDVLEMVQSYEVDELILTGDLCYKEGNLETYLWIRDKLIETGIPYHVISGNHDSSSLMAEAFNLDAHLCENELYYSKNIGSILQIFLDTAVGYMSKKQLDWLNICLKNIEVEEPVFLFMHHPPIFGGVKHMDMKYALMDETKKVFQDIIFNYRKPVHVFCGHFHTDKVISKENLHVHITPSCFLQIDPRFEDFKVEHLQIGFRHIVFNEGILQSSVHYLH